MTEEEVKAQIELIVDDFGIEIPERKIKKLAKLVIEELIVEDVSFEDITDEVSSILNFDDDEEDGEELIEELSVFIKDFIEENGTCEE
jgi:hypothetical protein